MTYTGIKFLLYTPSRLGLIFFSFLIFSRYQTYLITTNYSYAFILGIIPGVQVELNKPQNVANSLGFPFFSLSLISMMGYDVLHYVQHDNSLVKFQKKLQKSRTTPSPLPPSNANCP